VGKLITVTGGARSGKSSFAEELAQKAGGRILYVATALAIDDEMTDRINMHRLRRGDVFFTVEGYKDLGSKICEHKENVSVALIDCITIMITNLMLDENTDFDNCEISKINEIECKIINEIDNIISALDDLPFNVIVVTNEIGFGVVPENRFARIFRDIQGRVNQRLTLASNEVYIVFSGLPLRLK